MPLNGNSVGGAIVGLVLLVGCFFLLRHFLCWFFKINLMVDLLRTIEKNTRNGEEAPAKELSKVARVVDGLLPVTAASRVRAALDAISRKR
jgi:hypothetical protein